MIEPLLVMECWKALDFELDTCISRVTDGSKPEFGEMIRYQLGWNVVGFDTLLTGKRIRPLLLLFTTYALGGIWRKALPAAAAVELVHNFSLVHDDIQDQSEMRRGRDTVWVRWGIAQAINTGDAMLALANLEMLSLEEATDSTIVKAAAHFLNQATFELTRGQYLDLALEKVEEITLMDYFEMVKGKTGALFSACLALGALLAGKSPIEISKFLVLGEKMGLAFQIQDDYLGIWGQDGITGKSVVGDLFSKKKTYPVLYALENLSEVRDYWIDHDAFTQNDVMWIKQRLEFAAVDKKVLAVVDNLYADCTRQLSTLFKDSQNTEELFFLIDGLFLRNR